MGIQGLRHLVFSILAFENTIENMWARKIISMHVRVRAVARISITCVNPFAAVDASF
jgi:hypothetical protein